MAVLVSSSSTCVSYFSSSISHTVCMFVILLPLLLLPLVSIVSCGIQAVFFLVCPVMVSIKSHSILRLALSRVASFSFLSRHKTSIIVTSEAK
ncbi:hypothetical protein FN846DRAFT_964357 [Sphaerosporella brunnea]|uniref:Uncharacterized protein n=1 Tax=Sphaerosporella brunnea TaxID=1250544 RepID=A0A5J5EMY8_9PEZI|nr:hypothetical protein FN846DRAFT_964357 [Sphaerosporella brunnea]